MKEFDFVVVGGGSSGSVLAGRLSEDPNTTVCLIEAGHHGNTKVVNTPLGLVMMVPTTLNNWAFKTEPQAGLDGRRGYQPRGKVLGGSSAINAMVYVRGHRVDYDDWAAQGNPGWSYDEVLPYFIRSENNAAIHDEYHGNAGPLRVSNCSTDNPMGQRFVEAGVEAGFRACPDFNGADQEGVGIYQVTQHQGERWSAARGYLYPYLDRPNLHIITEAQAQRIVFDGKRAVGVEYRRDGVLEVVKARCEVLLSAGAFQSPQLLMLSGVGDAAHLAGMGIQTIHELPGVGQNLQDHADFIFAHRARSLDLIGSSLGGLRRFWAETQRYKTERRGMLASNAAEAGGFLKTDPALAAPDLQLHFCVAIVDNHGRTVRHLWHGYSLHVCVLRPKSRGEVALHSNDPSAAPLIDPRFFSHPDDMDVMVKGFKMARRIVDAKAFDPYRTEELFTADVHSDEEIRAAIRARSDTIYHPVGTCKMGVDSEAVVDPALRVHGLQGLRVVDASIMPTLIGGNTNAPAVMIAEKAVDMIRAAWK